MIAVDAKFHIGHYFAFVAPAMRQGRALHVYDLGKVEERFWLVGSSDGLIQFVDRFSVDNGAR